MFDFHQTKKAQKTIERLTTEILAMLPKMNDAWKSEDYARYIVISSAILEKEADIEAIKRQIAQEA